VTVNRIFEAYDIPPSINEEEVTLIGNEILKVIEVLDLDEEKAAEVREIFDKALDSITVLRAFDTRNEAADHILAARCEEIVGMISAASRQVQASDNGRDWFQVNFIRDHLHLRDNNEIREAIVKAVKDNVIYELDSNIQELKNLLQVYSQKKIGQICFRSDLASLMASNLPTRNRFDQEFRVPEVAEDRFDEALEEVNQNKRREIQT